MEEEGDVFRKGVVLLGQDEIEGEYAGDELRREVLETHEDEELMIDVDTVGPPPRFSISASSSFVAP